MFKEDNQSFWQLASIQSMALGLPVILVGEQLANQYGLGVAIVSLCIGNLILWIIGLAMYSMTYTRKGDAKHAIENVMAYFGRDTALIASVILMLAFISWFPVQIKAEMILVGKLFDGWTGWNSTFSIGLGAFIACIITFISMGGIRTIKWVCVSMLPLLCIYIVYALFRNYELLEGMVFNWGISIPAIISVIVIVFPGIINLPTFLRHARSRADGILALTLMTFFVIVFQAASIWLCLSSEATRICPPYLAGAGVTVDLVLILAFTGLSMLCVNLVNIYFASAAIEMVKPKFADARGYAIIGLIGTLVFGIVQRASILDNLQNLTTNFIGSLGAILLVAYLTKIIVKHRPRNFEKVINFVCWGLGCIASGVVLFTSQSESRAFMYGICVSLLAYLVFMFVEETQWAFNKLFVKYKNRRRV